jgi:hypothetical protein
VFMSLSPRLHFDSLDKTGALLGTVTSRATVKGEGL